jgi:hypothetical protein
MLCKEGCAIPALSCMQAAVMIHRMPWWEAIPALPCKLAAVVIHRMLWCKEGVLSCVPCKLAAVMIHRMLWWKKGVLPLRCHASCCCDSQNALVEEGVLLRCHASSLLL